METTYLFISLKAIAEFLFFFLLFPPPIFIPYDVLFTYFSDVV